LPIRDYELGPGANSIPRNHVPGRNIAPAPVIFIGEAPGGRENSLRTPFVGGAGQELERYCRSAGIDTSALPITNLVKYWPPLDARHKQLPPSPEDIARDEPELLAELAIVQPRVIVAIGAHAARYFLGVRFRSMRQCHGIPQPDTRGLGVIVLPTLHPAAGLHSLLAEEMARIQWDFQQVGKLLRGQLPLDRADAHPAPQYRRLYDVEGGAATLANLLAGRTEIAIDTEGTATDPECCTVSVVPGEGWLIEHTEHETLAALNAYLNAPHSICTRIFHYLVHDIPVCEALGLKVAHIPSINVDGSPAFRDTMNELHLLGGTEPKGLKAAEWRLCAMESESYEDVTKEAAWETSRAYLERAFCAAVCAECYGTGRAAAPYKLIDPFCEFCDGSGRVEGKRAGTTKQCACVRTADRCTADGCVDGLLIPLPERELSFDAARGEFRWKQPQSIAKWIKRRILSADLLDTPASDEPESDDDLPPALGAIDDADADSDELSAEVAPYFKLRRDWRALPPERRALIEALIGPMPRVRLLADVRDQPRVTRYACADSDGTLRVAHKLAGRVRELGVERAAGIDAAMLPILARMERNGMMIDRAHFEAFHDDLQNWLAEERSKLGALVGEHNPNSKRMVDVLFRDLQLPTIKLTAGNQASTDDETLGILKAQLKSRQREGHDSDLVRTGIAVIDCIQTYREFQKMDSTYVLAMLQKADAHGRVHTTINYTKSVSRLSSEEPNLQNIPNPDNSPFPGDATYNMGLRMRRGFIARPGYKIIEADYASIELVVGAHLTQDRNLMEIFINGYDPHYYVASNRLGVPMDQVPKPVRTQMKPLSFGAFYDASAERLHLQFALMQPPVEKTVPECQEMLDWYFSEFAPDVRAWKERVRRNAQADGMVRTMFGRLRWMPGLRSQIKRVRSAAERECTNFPIQGTARDILGVGLAHLWEDTLPLLWAEGIDAQPIMTVHDAVALEVPEEHAEAVGWMVAETMRNAVGLSVPVKVSVGIGDNWAEAH
jgi:uracil-DNA glycosylase family 4